MLRIQSTIFLALTVLIQSAIIIHGQQRSREELLKEAGRLATEAERAQGEAIKKVQSGADRSFIRDSQKRAAESFEKASADDRTTWKADGIDWTR